MRGRQAAGPLDHPPKQINRPPKSNTPLILSPSKDDPGARHRLFMQAPAGSWVPACAGTAEALAIKVPWERRCSLMRAHIVIVSVAWPSRRRSNGGPSTGVQPHRDCHVAMLLVMTKWVRATRCSGLTGIKRPDTLKALTTETDAKCLPVARELRFLDKLWNRGERAEKEIRCESGAVPPL